MFGLGNWIKESVSSGGTGNLTLGGAATGFLPFYSQFGDATTNTPARYFRYVISDGNDWEAGIGHMSATTTMVRDVPEIKSVSGTITRFPGAGSGLNVTTAAVVFCDFSAGASMMPNVAGSTSTGVPFDRSGENQINAALAANYIIAWGQRLSCSGVYSGIIDSVQAAAGTVYQLGIYAPGPDGMPNTLLARTADITPATGDNTHSFTANVYLSAGWYWAAWSGDGALNVYKLSQYGSYPVGIQGVQTGGSKLVSTYVYKSGLNNPLPATFPASPVRNPGTYSIPPLLSLVRTA